LATIIEPVSASPPRTATRPRGSRLGIRCAAVVVILCAAGLAMASLLQSMPDLSPFRHTLAVLRTHAMGTVNSAIWLSILFTGLLLLVVRQFRRHEARLRESESRLRDFAEFASDWLWEQDAELRFTWGFGIDSIRELTTQNFIGRTRWEFADLGQEEEAQRWAAHKADLTARRPFRDFQYHHVAHDGRIRHLSVSGTPLFDTNGAFVGYRGTANDITAKVEAEAELRRARDTAEAASRAKSEFLAMMSHELRTPLHAIIGFSELISEQPFDPIDAKYVQYAKDIHVSGMHLLDLINEMLDLSTLDAGRYELRNERVALRSMVDTCARMLAPAVKDRKVQVELTDSLTSVHVWADRRAMKQIVLNLMSNAVKFTQAGGAVSVSAETAANGDLEIYVVDTGIGIEQCKLEHVFEPFYQVDGKSNRKYGGVGLGLAICRKLLALHGGSIAIASQRGLGTSVQVTLRKDRVFGGTDRQRSPMHGPDHDDAGGTADTAYEPAVAI
jgi:PAS domain S-box-containing protein